MAEEQSALAFGECADGDDEAEMDTNVSPSVSEKTWTKKTPFSTTLKII